MRIKALRGFYATTASGFRVVNAGEEVEVTSSLGTELVYNKKAVVVADGSDAKKVEAKPETMKLKEPKNAG